MASNVSAPKLSPEEIKLRGSLLARNKDLLKLHKELVFGGLLTEEEFWESRRGMLRDQDILLRQKKGLSSSLVADELKPVAGGGSDVKYILTPAIMQTIFEQHPAMRRAFTELVTTPPDREQQPITEKEFWIEYFKSKFFHEASHKPTSDSSLLDRYYEQSEKRSVTHRETEPDAYVDPLVNLSRSQEDHVSGYVRYEQEVASADPAWNALRHFNKHSLRILHTTQRNRQHHVPLSTEYIEISDLSVATEPSLATLTIQEGSLFGGSQRSDSHAMDVDPSNDSWRQELSDALASFDNDALTRALAPIDYSQHQTLMTSVLQRNFPVSASESDPLALSSLQGPSTDELNAFISSTVEVLRHFWSAAALANAADRTTKITRMVAVLDKMEGKLQGWMKDAHGPSGRIIARATENLRATINRARSRYIELTGATR